MIKSIRKIASRARRELGGAKYQEILNRIDARPVHALPSLNTQISQRILTNQYRALLGQGGPILPFANVEFRVNSQNGEDGILHYIFSLIGMGARRCVEICAGDGEQCNTANLVINHGWHGLMFEGDATLVERGRNYYARLGDTFAFPPRIVHAWIDRENINALIRDNGFEGPVDLLSLDIDGVDYWLWEAIDVIQPRVVVAEVQCIWGPEHAVTVPYASDFRATYVDGFGIYCGASLLAFTKLARKKGYRLVGVQRLGFNAFFVKDGVGEDVLPEVDVETCADLPFVKWARATLFDKIKEMTWERV